MLNLDILDYGSGHKQSLPELENLLRELDTAGIHKLFIDGYEYDLSECSFEWKAISTSSQKILGLSDDELPHRWQLIFKRRELKAQLSQMREAIEKRIKQNSDED